MKIKDFLYIIKRIIIGVGIALILMYIKGNLFLYVNAKGTFNPSGFSVYNGTTEELFDLQLGSHNATNYYGRVFQNSNTRTAVWKFNTNLDTSTTYDFNFTGYFSVNTNSSFNVRGFIQDSTGFINSCDIDSSIWSRISPNSSSITTLSSDAIISCNNVQLRSNSFNFYLMNIITTQNGFIGISPVSYKENDIINNQNKNTQKEIESQKVCNQIDNISIKEDNKFLTNDGTISTQNNSSLGVTDYINVYQGTLKVLNNYEYSTYTCFYDVNKTKISCISNNTLTVNDIITLPNNSYYMRTTINKTSNKPRFEICQNGNQALSGQNQQLQSTLTDSSTTDADSQANDFFGSFNSNSHGLSGVISSPLRLIQSLSSSSCSPLVVPLPFVNKNVTFPCMSTIYSTHFSSFLNIYRIITTGLIGYWITIRLFSKIKDFQDPNNDKVEVLDL